MTRYTVYLNTVNVGRFYADSALEAKQLAAASLGIPVSRGMVVITEEVK